MTLQLRSLQHPNLLLPLGASPVRIGRGSENELVISEASVSRHHAVIQLQNGVPVVTDLDSTRGTFINGTRIKSGPINSGDVVTFGAIQWRVEQTATAGAAASPAQPTTAALYLRSVKNPALQFPVSGAAVTVGRDSGNAIQVRSNSVSRRHAQIWFQNGQPVVSDLNSTRGTFINGVRVQSGPIKAGDVIAFGDQQWQVMAGAPLAAAPLPSRQFAVRRNLSLLGIGAVVVLALVLLLAGGVGPRTAAPEVAVEIGPLVILHDPLPGSVALINYPLLISADARDQAGIERVELWVDGLFAGAQLIDSPGEATEYAFVANWTPSTLGMHDLFVRAFTADERMGQSMIVTVSAEPAVVEAMPGDTLESLAADNGLTVDEIKEANPELWSPDPGSEVFVSGCPADVTYTVRNGETVADLAATFGLSAQDILSANPGLTAEPPAGTQVRLRGVSANLTYQIQPGDNWLLVASLMENDTCGEQPVEQSLIDWIVNDGYRDPAPGEMINLFDWRTPVDEGGGQPLAPETAPTGDTGLTDPGDLPPPVSNVTAQDGDDCQSVQLSWALPESAVSKIRLYGRAPGSAVMSQLDELGANSKSATVAAAIPGPWQFFVGSQDRNGLENLARVEHDTSECAAAKGSYTDPLTIQIHVIKAPIPQLYCYVRVGGDLGLYQRVPEGDGNFITQSRAVRHYSGALIKINSTYTFNLMWDYSRNLEVEFDCYGWSSDLMQIAVGQAVHPPNEWDGRRHVRDFGDLRVEYTIQPKSWKELGGQRALDPNFPPPYNLQSAQLTMRVAGERNPQTRRTLTWQWKPGPGQAETSVAGFQLILREYTDKVDNGVGKYRESILDEVFGSSTRTSSWPFDEGRECGRWANLYARAFGHGPSISDYSKPLTLEPIPCPVRGGRIAYGQTVAGSIQNRFIAEEWTFTGKAGDRAVITGSPTSGDLKMLIQLKKGSTILKEGELSKWGQNNPYRLPTDGEYTIRVTRVGLYNGSTAGNYSLHLEKLIPNYEVTIEIDKIHVIRREDGIMDDAIYAVWSYADRNGPPVSGTTEILTDLDDGETKPFGGGPVIANRQPGESFSFGVTVFESEKGDTALFNKVTRFATKVAAIAGSLSGVCPSWGDLFASADFAELAELYGDVNADPAGSQFLTLVPSPCSLAEQGVNKVFDWLYSLDKDDKLGAVDYRCELADGVGAVCTPVSKKTGSSGGSRFTVTSSTGAVMSYSGETWGYTDVDIPGCGGSGNAGKLILTSYTSRPSHGLWGSVKSAAKKVGKGVLKVGEAVVDTAADAAEWTVQNVICPTAEGVATVGKMGVDTVTGQVKHSYGGELTIQFQIKEK